MNTKIMLEIVQKDFPSIVDFKDQGNYIDFYNDKNQLVASLSKSTLKAMLVDEIALFGEDCLD